MKIHNYDTTLPELSKCPFCGGKPVAYLLGNKYTKKILITIKCSKCMVSRTTGAIGESVEWLENTAIRQWNERV